MEIKHKYLYSSQLWLLDAEMLIAPQKELRGPTLPFRVPAAAVAASHETHMHACLLSRFILV